MRKLFITLLLILLPMQAYGAAATMYVTPAGAGAKTGADWANAMSITEFETDYVTLAEAGDIYNIYTGTYNMPNSFVSARDGNSASYVHLVGVSDQLVPPTPAQDDDRPLFNCGSYAFQLPRYADMFNMRFEGSSSNMVQMRSTEWHVGNFSAISTGGIPFYAANGIGLLEDAYIETTSSNWTAYFKGGQIEMRGVEFVGGTQVTLHDDRYQLNYIIFRGQTVVGLTHLGSTDYIRVDNSTFNDLPVAADFLNTTQHRGTNNNVSNCVIGFTATTQLDNHYFDWNNYDSNGTDVVNINKGVNATANASGYTDAGAGDFSVGASMAGNGFPGEFPSGLSTGYMEQGAVQRASSTSAATPTFSGITDLRREDTGLTAYWDDGTGTITSYNIYIDDDAVDVDDSANLLVKLPNTRNKYFIDTMPDGTFLIGTTTYYVMIKAENDGSEDTNSVTYSSSPVTRWIPQKVGNGVNIN